MVSVLNGPRLPSGPSTTPNATCSERQSIHGLDKLVQLSSGKKSFCVLCCIVLCCVGLRCVLPVRLCSSCRILRASRTCCIGRSISTRDFPHCRSIRTQDCFPHHYTLSRLDLDTCSRIHLETCRRLHLDAWDGSPHFDSYTSLYTPHSVTIAKPFGCGYLRHTAWLHA